MNSTVEHSVFVQLRQRSIEDGTVSMMLRRMKRRSQGTMVASLRVAAGWPAAAGGGVALDQARPSA
jgi:hypothetical protein